VDLHSGTISANSSTLEVACDPPGIGAEKSAEIIRTALELWSSYAFGSVALECAVVDLHGALPNINSTALGVACPPPGIGANQIVHFIESAPMERKSSANES
jgi:hypothetical protein